MALILLVTPCASVQAREPISMCEAAESDHYLTKAGGMFMRGAANAGLCWLEFFHQPMKAAEEGDSILLGTLKGPLYALIRAGQGAGDMLLALAPPNREGEYPRVASGDCTLGILGLEER